MIKERIDIKNIDGQLFEIKVIDADNSKPASFTHYLHNCSNLFVSSSQKGFPLQFLMQNAA